MREDINKNNDISVSSYISKDVKMGKKNVIERNVCIYGNVEIGDNNYISSGAVIGGYSRQMKKPKRWDPIAKEGAKIYIGNNNMIGEYVTIGRPMMGITEIHDNNSIGAHSHVGHDVKIYRDVIIGINVSIAGYVILGNYSNVGMGVRIHQRSVIGEYSMCGMGSIVKGYVFPGIIVSGMPAVYNKINEEGLRRNGFKEEEIKSFICELTESKCKNKSARVIINEFLKDCEKWKREKDNFKYINAK